MRMSRMVGSRFKERPAEATLESHALLLRGGYARQVSNGIYSLLPPALRVVKKIENIIREEMDRIGGQEVLMPVVMPRELWEESGRYDSVGSELVRFQDRTGHDMVLGMTHEEGVVHLVRNEVNSYTQLPFMVYQIQTKFRDEPRSRGGLIRVREFTMKDGYSFHATQEDLEAYYQECFAAYERIFARVGLPQVVATESDSGMMGGALAHEFMLLTEAGEDTIVVCEEENYVANMEVATSQVTAYPAESQALEKVATPGKQTIEEVAGFLGLPIHQTAKAVLYEEDAEGKLVIALVRGDRDVNELKLAKIIGTMLKPASDEKIKSAGAVPGYASPMGLDADKVRIIIDHTIAASNNLVTGANEVDYHYTNFNLERDLPGIETVDIINVAEGDTGASGKGTIALQRGIEVGNIFQLGTKYTESMGMTYLDENGKSKIPIMGCYGIGVGRLMGSIMEASHGDRGPIWPITVAPWQVHLSALKFNKDEIKETAEKLYADLTAVGLEVLFDDRNARPGPQFADADLLGIPVRIVVGDRNLKDGNLEYKRLDLDDSGTIPLEGAIEVVKKWVDEATNTIESKV